MLDLLSLTDSMPLLTTPSLVLSYQIQTVMKGLMKVLTDMGLLE